MYVVMGAGGHVGSAVAERLLMLNQPVTVVVRDPDRVDAWRSTGAQVSLADIRNVEALRSALRSGRRAFLLNPPADIREDTDEVERHTVANILASLEGTGLEKIVA